MNTSASSRLGLVVVAHAPLAGALVAAARHVVGETTALAAVDVAADETPAAAGARVAAACTRLDTGAGSLILVDMAGATPANAALAHAREHDLPVVAGLSLPMLVRAANYADRDALALVELVVAAASRHAVCLTHPERGSGTS